MLEKRRRLSRYRHPERSLSRGRNLLAFGLAVPAAHYPWTGPARWLRDQLSRRQENLPCRRDWLQLQTTARSEWMALPTQEVVAIFLCQPSRVHEETSYAGRTGSSFENLHVRMGHPPRPRSCSLPLVCRVQGPCRMAPRQCQQLRIRMLRPGRTRTFAPAPAQHNIPIDGLFSFTLPCATQNTWHLPTAFLVTSRRSCLISGLPKWTPIHSVGGCAHFSSRR